MSSASERLRPGQPDDLPFIVKQHRDAFPEGFCAQLGDAFLTEYFRSFLTDSSSCVLVAESAGSPIGYLVGSPRPVQHRQHVMRLHGRRLCILGAVALLRRPPLAVAFMGTRTRRYLRSIRRQPIGRSSTPVPGSEAVGVLHHVVVLPEHQGLGVGSALIRTLEQVALADGCTHLLLVTRADGLGPAYYRYTGWDPQEERHTDEGHRLLTFTRALDESCPPHSEFFG